MPSSRRKLVAYGLGGLAALLVVAAVTAAAIYVGAAFVVRYARLPQLDAAPATKLRTPPR